MNFLSTRFNIIISNKTLCYKSTDVNQIVSSAHSVKFICEIGCFCILIGKLVAYAPAIMNQKLLIYYESNLFTPKFHLGTPHSTYNIPNSTLHKKYRRKQKNCTTTHLTFIGESNSTPNNLPLFFSNNSKSQFLPNPKVWLRLKDSLHKEIGETMAILLLLL